MSTTALLEMRGVTKAFGAVRALKGIDFAVAPGEIVVLLGENGAGKSTLLKALTGGQPADTGTILWQGQPAIIDSPRKAQSLGIRMVYQELNLAPHLTVAENICLGTEPVRGPGLVHHGAVRERARRLLDEHRFALDPDAPVASLGVAQRQLVEICKALAGDARLLLLDEPTSSLGEREIDDLFATLRGLKARGLGIVYVSHRLEECFAIGDRIVVLRDGEKVYEAPIPETDTATVVRQMVGRDLADFYPKEPVEPGPVRLVVRDLVLRGAPSLGPGPHPRPLSPAPGFAGGRGVSAPASTAPPREGYPERVPSGAAAVESAPGTPLPPATAGSRGEGPGVRAAISFEARAGEIVGVAGLLGSGRSALLSALFGLRPGATGTVLVDGREAPLRRGPKGAIRQGFGLLTEDRKRTGLAIGLPVRHNITLAALGKLGGGPLLAQGRDRSAARTMIERLRVKTSSTEAPVGSLSGGNQQKTVIARWLFADSSILLFDEPTRGIDVGSKVEVYRLMNDLARQGAVILMVSSELPELLGMSDRILVLHRGRLAADLPRADATAERVLHFAMTGADIEEGTRDEG